MFCQSGVWSVQIKIWNEIPPKLITSIVVNGPQRFFSVQLDGSIPSNAKFVRLYIESIDGDSNDGINACGPQLGGCAPVRSSILGYGDTGISNSIIFLNQQKNLTGIWSAASYTGQLPVAGNLIHIDKGAGIQNTQGGGMHTNIYVIGYI